MGSVIHAPFKRKKIQIVPRYDIEGQPVPSVTQIISGIGLSKLPPVSKAILEAKGEIGTNTHEYANLRLSDDVIPLRDLRENSDLRSRKFFTAYEAWHKLYTPKAYTTELTLNDGAFFAGTLDALCLVLEKYIWLIDFKTRAMTFADRFQLAAYKHLLEYCSKFSAEGRKCIRVVVELKENGKFKVNKLPEDEYENDINIFLKAVDIWHVRYANDLL